MNREDVAPLCCLPAGMRVWLVTGLLSCLGLVQAQPVVLEGGAMAGSFANGPAYTGSLFLTGVPPSAAVLLTSDNSRPSLVLTSLTGTGAALSANLTYGSAIQGRGKVDGLVDGPPISVTSTATLSTNARSTPLTLPPSGFSANLETFGALSVRSLGVNQSSGWGGAGGAVNLQILAGTLSVGIPSTGPGAGVGPVWQPWASAIYAQSLGGNSNWPNPADCPGPQKSFQYRCDIGDDHVGDAGSGGAVSVQVHADTRLVLDGRAYQGSDRYLLGGLTAVSQGGQNGWTAKSMALSSIWGYGNAGSGGAVTVDFAGAISAPSSSAGALGIVAASLGADLVCPNNSCDAERRDYSSWNYLGNYVSQTPGSGGAVNVTLRSTGSIDLSGPRGMGILALSGAGGAVVMDDRRSAVDNANRSGGPVTLVTEAGSRVRVGTADSRLAMGVVAMSTGNASLIYPAVLEPRTDPVWPSDLHVYLPQSAAAGGAVTVDNAAAVTAQGTAAIGVAALSVGGAANIDPTGRGGRGGRKRLGDTGSTVANGLVSLTNTGTVTTQGDYAAGLMALSASAGGIMLIDAPPLLAGCDANYTLGGPCKLINDGTSLGGGDQFAGPGGAVQLTHAGRVDTGLASGDGRYAMGVMAQSIGGGGGSAYGFNLFVGGEGCQGGNGGTVTTSLPGGTVLTRGLAAIGVLSQSVGGGGGTGGSVIGMFQSVGGRGGIGGDGGAAQASLSSGAVVSTEGHFAQGVLVQSIGGGGGAGGYAASAGPFYAGAVGGQGGRGGIGGSVVFTSDASSVVKTTGDGGQGVLVQSVGGGGGTGGGSVAISLGIVADAALAVGGSGGQGGLGGQATATIAGTIETRGGYANAVLVQSIGGGGGVGGQSLSMAWTAAVPDLPSFTASVSVGGSGGSGNSAGKVTLTHSEGSITTRGDDAVAILAQSIGGGGGSGGDSKAITGSVPFTQSAGSVKASVSIGGQGGVGGTGGAVIVDNGSSANTVASILTLGDGSDGILAQSIGGGGGAGGEGHAKDMFNQKPVSLSINVGVGGSGGSGNHGGSVSVNNQSLINTYGGDARGIFAQSIGGGGGKAGGGGANGLGDTVNIQVGVGGTGGAGGNGGKVQVSNTGRILTGSQEAVLDAETGANYLITTGGGSIGILAQSIGGGGGVGGSADAASVMSNLGVGMGIVSKIKGVKKAATEANKGLPFHLNANVHIAGAGGAAGDGAEVFVTNSGEVRTLGDRSFGIQAQSIGGGGGNGGSVEASPAHIQNDIAAFQEVSLTGVVSVGGGGGSAGNGSMVTVVNAGHSVTAGYGAIGIFAQSIGGGGGFGADNTANTEGTFSLGLAKNGNGGLGGDGGYVQLSHTGSVLTLGNDAAGILAQSIGGGGGVSQGACENSGDHADKATSLSASACLGFAQITAGQGETIWSPQTRYKVKLGGGQGVSGDGRGVHLDVDGDVRTTGDRSLGVVAQSIGGGGGYMTAAASSLDSAVVGADAGQNTGRGGSVSVTVSKAITTSGNGAWGVLAQSIGSGGGLVGDTSLDMLMPVSNTLANLCCKSGQVYGADGGNVTIHNAGVITTSGRNAHGIVAQSVGGGGGIAAGYSRRTDVNVVMGNSQQLYPGGLVAPTQSGQGGMVKITNAGSIQTTGVGSVGILAQSSGNREFMSQIQVAITGSGSVIGGTGPSAAGIMLSGGDAANNRHGSTPNTITVDAGASVTTVDGVRGRAIVADYGLTNLINRGTITGSIDLGSTPGTVANFGTIHAGKVLTTSNGTFTNEGVLVLGGAGSTELAGGLRQTAAGRMQVRIDPAADPGQPVLSVRGDVNIAGSVSIQPLSSLLPGARQVIAASRLEFTGKLESMLLYQWAHKTVGQTLAVSAEATFAPEGVALNKSHSSLAGYLSTRWGQGDAALSGLFGHMTQVGSAEDYRQMLEVLGGRALHQHAAVAMQSLPVLLDQSIDCPRFASAGVLLELHRCAWGKWSRTSGDQGATANPATHVTSNLVSVGGQFEVNPGWWLGGSFGAVSGHASATKFSSSGETWFGTVALRRVMGDWTLAQSVALGRGTYDNQRHFSLPTLEGLPAEAQVSFGSRSNLLLAALKSRVAWQHAFSDGVHIAPYADLDLLRTQHAAFDERAEGRALSLKVRSGSNTYAGLSPMFELGGQRDLADFGALRVYARAGLRWTPDASPRLRMSIADASSESDTFETRDPLPSVTRIFNLGVTLHRSDRFDLVLELAREVNQQSDANRGTMQYRRYF